MPIFIILGIILQIFIHNDVAWCSTPNNRMVFNISNNNIFQGDLHKQEMKLYSYNHSPYTLNKLRAHAYNYKSPFSSTYTSKIQLQNDAMNVFHSFHTQQSKYQKSLSFMQLGIRNILSEHVFNFGGGTRYLVNDKYAIGYNVFYHCPTSNINQNSQAPAINIGVEYWLKNTSFTLNNYYNLDNVFVSTKTSLKKYNIHRPRSGYQLHIQTKFPHFLEFTGKIKLEQFFYDKKHKNCSNKKNNDHCLSLDLHYQPIPILGFGISNIFINKKYNNTICQVLIDYQFGTSLTKQISYINKQNKSMLNNLDIIIQPFIPSFIQCHDHMILNKHNHATSLQSTQKITGYPGEVKIITIDNSNDKSILWDFQLLQNQGGDVIMLTNNTYAIYFPTHLITQEDKILISYITNATKTSQEQKKQNIHILVKDFSQQKFLNTHKPDVSAIDVNDDSGINITEDTTEHTVLTCNDDDDYHSIKNGTTSTLNVVTQHNNVHDDNVTIIKKTQSTTVEDNCTFSAPPPPPMPLSLLEKKEAAASELNDALLSSCSSRSLLDQQINSERTENKNTHDALIKHSKIESDQNDDLSYRLFLHKQTKFADLGTEEHINKLEHAIKERKKTKHFSDMEQMFIKLNLQKSSSSASVSEDYATDDSNDDSF